MTGKRRARFDNYPREPDPGADAFHEDSLDPAPSWVAPPAPLGPLPVLGHAPPSRPGYSRRVALRLAVGLPVSVVVLIAAVKTVVQFGTAGTKASVPNPSPAVPHLDERTTVTAGYDSSATVPDGWMIQENVADQVILSAGSNWVLAHAFVARSKDNARGLLKSLTELKRGSFVGALGKTEDDSDQFRQHATLQAVGLADGKPAKLRAQLYIVEDSNALLVIQTLTTGFGTVVDGQADLLVLEWVSYYA